MSSIPQRGTWCSPSAMVWAQRYTAYIAPLMKLFEIGGAHLSATLLSYINDGTIISQAKDWDFNLTCLKEAYRIIFGLF